MQPNPKFPADLVTFNKEIFNGKLHFLCSETNRWSSYGSPFGLTLAKLCQCHFKEQWMLDCPIKL